MCVVIVIAGITCAYALDTDVRRATLTKALRDPGTKNFYTLLLYFISIISSYFTVRPLPVDYFYNPDCH